MYLLSLICTVLVPLALTMFMISCFHVSLTICFFVVLSRDLLHLRLFPQCLLSSFTHRYSPWVIVFRPLDEKTEVI